MQERPDPRACRSSASQSNGGTSQHWRRLVWPKTPESLAKNPDPNTARGGVDNVDNATRHALTTLPTPLLLLLSGPNLTGRRHYGFLGNIIKWKNDITWVTLSSAGTVPFGNIFF